MARDKKTTMSDEEKKDYAQIFRDAVVSHIPMESWKKLNAATEQMTLDASKKNHGEIDVDELVKSCHRMEALIEAETLNRTKRLGDLAKQKADLNKAVDELESQAKYGKRSREDWLRAGMPTSTPAKIMKPLTFNKKPCKTGH